MKIFIPFPPAILNPNKHKHWATKNGPRADYRERCRKIASQLAPVFPEGNIPVRILFIEPDKKMRDIDNMHASLKAAIDGICTAWGINDKRLRPILLDVGAPDKKEPRVEITFKI